MILWLGLAFEAASFIPSYCQNVSPGLAAQTPAMLVPTVASSVGAAPNQLGSPSLSLASQRQQNTPPEQSRPWL